MKKGIYCDWIRSAGCLLHYEGTEDGIVIELPRISIPWLCKQNNQSMNKANRQKVIKREFLILSHQ